MTVERKTSDDVVVTLRAEARPEWRREAASAKVLALSYSLVMVLLGGIALVARHRSPRVREFFEMLRVELGYADYLGALQRYRAENPRDPRFVADLAEQGQRFLEHGLGVGDRLTIDHSGKGRIVKGVGQRAVVSQLAGQPDTFVVKTLGDIHVALPVGQSTGGLEGSQPFF